MAQSDAERFVQLAVVMTLARGQSPEAVAELAERELGLHFSGDELHAASEQLQASALAESDELSDDALDGIAGGRSFSIGVGLIRYGADVKQDSVTVSVSTRIIGEEGGMFGSPGKVQGTFGW